MTIHNTFVKKWTGFQSSLETAEQLSAVDADTTALAPTSRTRRKIINTFTYSGGSAAAAQVLKTELEADPTITDIYGYENAPPPDYVSGPLPWTITANQITYGAWS